MWIQTGVTVRKRLSWVVTSVTLTFDLWPWTFAWTLLSSLVKTPENYMMIPWWEHSQKGVTDGWTDGQTDRRTENTICRAAWSQHKIYHCSVLLLQQPASNHCDGIKKKKKTPLNLTYWGRVMHICGSKLTTIDSGAVWSAGCSNDQIGALFYLKTLALVGRNMNPKHATCDNSYTILRVRLYGWLASIKRLTMKNDTRIFFSLKRHS